MGSLNSAVELIKELEKDPSKEAHFGSLMELCHFKNVELSKKHQRYKGRVVFRGDNVRGKEGCLAVFSEQGTGASHQAAAKLVDAIARLPGNDGEEADACGAYTQAWLGGPETVSQAKCPETWIALPKHQWPVEWIGVYEKPVVRLYKALYGHPLAGLYWEKHCRQILLDFGWEPVKGWECLYLHRHE